MKRFYKLVSVVRSAQGYEIHLDGRPVKTPAKSAFYAPNEKLADLVMQEWAAQEESIKPDHMPLTQLISTKLDHIAAERPAMSEMVLKYLNTDMICYLSDDPEGLIAAEDRVWTPHREWFADRFGTALETTTGLVALTQPEAAHMAVKTYVEALDDDRFTLLQLVTSLSGSLILALAFVEGQIDAQGIYDCARVQEQFKAKIYDEAKYGPDPAQEKKDAAMMVDLRAAQTYLSSLR